VSPRAGFCDGALRLHTPRCKMRAKSAAARSFFFEARNNNGRLFLLSRRARRLSFLRCRIPQPRGYSSRLCGIASVRHSPSKGYTFSARAKRYGNICFTLLTADGHFLQSRARVRCGSKKIRRPSEAADDAFP
jgi:hypothetical protein